MKSMAKFLLNTLKLISLFNSARYIYSNRMRITWSEKGVPQQTTGKLI